MVRHLSNKYHRITNKSPAGVLSFWGALIHYCLISHRSHNSGINISHSWNGIKNICAFQLLDGARRPTCVWTGALWIYVCTFPGLNLRGTGTLTFFIYCPEMWWMLQCSFVYCPQIEFLTGWFFNDFTSYCHNFVLKSLLFCCFNNN